MEKNRKIVIGSRESRLAVIQSEMVRSYLLEKLPGVSVELLTMKTTGDKILDRTLDKVGGKGLFVKELDRALLEGRSDLSVHSLKDMPMEVDERLPLLAFSAREDERDALVLPEGAEKLDESKPIGCSSLRRILQLKRLFPHMEFKSVRGNVQTRLAKLEAGEYSALVLAVAGLKRLGLENRISRYFTAEEVIPAAGQGILAVQGRSGEDYGYLEAYDCREARIAALAERAFVRQLNGGCSSPVAAHAVVTGEEVELTGLYYREADGAWWTGMRRGTAEQAEELGASLARELAERGKGKVWLVGAGPGDPGLFTLKGREVLAQAQVVVYDSLVGDGVLAMIPEKARLINVGKRAGNHTMRQEQINEALLAEAKKGFRVVRLKGGDPFLFGRGGEELELLAAEGIPYEIVPGVTSSIAVPAYNGIPVTHRDFCSSVHIITGHKRAGQELDIDFEALVRTEGTLVFLMGVTAMPDILAGLLRAGMDPNMPAAVLQQGTTAGQRRVVASVSTLEKAARDAGIGTPAIIVVGKVCGLAEGFSWYEKLPLAGYKVLVTRPRELSSAMAARLRSQGAEVLELPAIATRPISDNQPLAKALERLESYSWLAFTSPTGVRLFFQAMSAAGKDVRSLSCAKVAAIGEGTGRALAERGILADLIPKVYDGKSLGEALAAECQQGARILIPRAALGNHEILEALEGRSDLQVEDVAVYETYYPRQEVLDQAGKFQRGEIDCAVFTSASTVKGFVEATPGLDYSLVRAACIGKQTKAAADRYGMETYMAEKATMDSLAELVAELAGKKGQR